MASYPSFPQWIGSKLDWVDDLVVDRAVGGGIRGRAFFNAKKPAFTIKHRLNSTDRATLRTFYDTNRTVGGISLTWAGDGIAYTNCWLVSIDESPAPESP